MKHFLQIAGTLAMLFIVAGCGFRVFISDTRLRGPVPDPAELAAQATVEASVAATAEAPATEEEEQAGAIIADLVTKLGEDLEATNAFSGRETPRAGPLRGMRVEAGDTIRISSGRSQETAVEGEEYCVDQGQRCSVVWVYGRPGGMPQGAWYPIAIFDYELQR